MRSQARALVLVIVSFVTVMALGVASAFVSALAYGATALIVPGTGTPDPDIEGYRENAWSRYIGPLVCATDCADPDLVGIPYPASFWPMSFLPGWCVPGRCEKWDVSVDEGVDHLMAALDPFLGDSDEDVYIFGYSQGGAVVANALAEIAGLDLPDAVKDRLKVVTIGGIQNPDGGLWQRLAWLRFLLGDPVPILDLSFEPPMPTDTGIATTTIGFEYDPVVYAPRYWGNLFAIANMIAAFDTVHGYYLAPNAEDDLPMPYGYTDQTLAPQLDCGVNPGNCRFDDFGNSYIMIPATSLPLTDLVRSLADSAGLGWLAKPFIDLAEPVLRELVDLGYDWSGNPAVSRGSTILPFNLFQNWLKVGVDLVVAAVKGVEAFIQNFIPKNEVQSPDVGESTEDAAAAIASQSRSTIIQTDVGKTAVTEGTVEEEAAGTGKETATGDETTGDETVIDEDEVTTGEETVTDDETVIDEDEVTVDHDAVDIDDADQDATDADTETADPDTETADTETADTETETADTGTPAAA
ncbi:PE-PPE domain-containing protein [Mycobacterium sp. SMC-8]|uniref:PE-PPE domain-containing protein n=1 Tax=Mycobacterium sp. SMC-8 TaxID=2857060 RepID=UPI0021B360D0|nr:PE-PPE domain-containing protein [Mycobacterium sp. SMC-8]UXA14579.1 PE-PPE domain-containing protein [Mycobacterium sp. SMC-8]